MNTIKKVDLHLHLDGSVSVPLLEKLSREAGYGMSMETILQRAAVSGDCRNLMEYLRCFDFVLPLLQTKQALCLAACDLVKRLDKDGLVYAEIRFAPQLHTEKEMDQQQAVEAVLEGVARARQEGAAVQTGVLLCMMVTGEYEKNRETAELAAAYKKRGVVGLDLAGAEGAVPMSAFQELFTEADRAGVLFTIHAGECGDYENIARAVSFGAKRIGHGCGAVFSKECMELLRREGIVVEACPTSNLQTKAVSSIKEHPIRTFFDEGILVTVNTDNMTVSGTSLEKEYLLLKNHLHFTDEEIVRMNEIALKAGFSFE